MGVVLKTFPKVTAAVANTAVPLSNTPILVSAALVQSLTANTGTQYIGDSTVTTSNGVAFSPGEDAEVDGPPTSKGHEQFDLSKIYVVATIANTEFRVLAWVRA